MKIAVVSPHPDDETLGAGGTLLRMKDEGHQIFWINVTNVIDKPNWSEEFAKRRKEQIDKISRLYRFDGFFDLNLEPTCLDLIGQKSIVDHLDEAIKKIEPNVLIIPDDNDVHTDHYCVNKAALACSKVFRYPYIKMILTMEILSESEFGNSVNGFIPNYFINITDYIEEKCRLLKIYDTEIGKVPFPRSIEVVKSLACFRGSTAGVGYAEGFKLIKMIL